LLAISFIFIFLLLSSLYSSYQIAFSLLIPSLTLSILLVIWSVICQKSFHMGTYLGLLLLVGVSVDSTTLYWEKFSKLSSDRMIPKHKIQTIAFRWFLGPVSINHLTSIIGILPVFIYGFYGMEIPYSIISILVPGFIFSFFLQCTLTPYLICNLFPFENRIQF
ncbi:MAG: efflux RND transporter permease subunit, partial [Leptospira sp.]|nr:efflux RND transporter permease subunit [Leptospira sp.]